MKGWISFLELFDTDLHKNKVWIIYNYMNGDEMLSPRYGSPKALSEILSWTMFHLGNVKFGLGDINVVFGLEIYNVLKETNFVWVEGFVYECCVGIRFS